jgi:hypothetical protein
MKPVFRKSWKIKKKEPDSPGKARPELKKNLFTTLTSGLKLIRFFMKKTGWKRPKFWPLSGQDKQLNS